MAPPLEHPSTAKPLPAQVARAPAYSLAAAGDDSDRPQLSLFLRRVAHQMQLDAEVLHVSPIVIGSLGPSSQVMHALVSNRLSKSSGSVKQ